MQCENASVNDHWRWRSGSKTPTIPENGRKSQKLFFPPASSFENYPEKNEEETKGGKFPQSKLSPNSFLSKLLKLS
jgi:hypothetical protein